MSKPTAGALLAAENGGTEIIMRDSDGAVFIRQDVAERVIRKLQRQLADTERALACCGHTLRGSYAERALARCAQDLKRSYANRSCDPGT